MKTLSLVPLGFLLLSIGLALSACSSLQRHEELKNQVSSPPVDEESNPSIDIFGLQHSLGMERAAEDLGYAEKSFNSCEVGHGFSASHDCRRLYLVVIHFQLQCRDSEGTETSTNYSVRPIITDRLRWNLSTGQGIVGTSAEGYGQILWVTEMSQKRQKLRLTHNGRFLILTAGDVRRIVTPAPWCENNSSRSQ